MAFKAEMQGETTTDKNKRKQNRKCQSDSLDVWDNILCILTSEKCNFLKSVFTLTSDLKLKQHFTQKHYTIS